MGMSTERRQLIEKKINILISPFKLVLKFLPKQRKVLARHLVSTLLWTVEKGPEQADYHTERASRMA